MAKRVLITGHYRSGSTWLFNVARLVCAHFAPTYSCFHDRYNPTAAAEAEFEVIKVHKYLPDLITEDTTILTTFREPDEVLASMDRLRSLGENDNWTDADRLPVYYAWWGMWNAEAADRKLPFRQVHFNSISRSPARQVKYIGETLRLLMLNETVDHIAKTVASLQVPKQGQDHTTLLRKNHITQ